MSKLSMDVAPASTKKLKPRLAKSKPIDISGSMSGDASKIMVDIEKKLQENEVRLARIDERLRIYENQVQEAMEILERGSKMIQKIAIPRTVLGMSDTTKKGLRQIFEMASEMEGSEPRYVYSNLPVPIGVWASGGLWLRDFRHPNDEVTLHFRRHPQWIAMETFPHVFRGIDYSNHNGIYSVICTNDEVSQMAYLAWIAGYECIGLSL